MSGVVSHPEEGRDLFLGRLPPRPNDLRSRIRSQVILVGFTPPLQKPTYNVLHTVEVIFFETRVIVSTGIGVREMSRRRCSRVAR